MWKQWLKQPAPSQAPLLFLEKASVLNFNCRLLYDLSFVWTVDVLQTDSGDSWAMSCNLTILVKAPLCCVVKQNSLFSIPLSIYPIFNPHLQSIFIHFHRGQKIARRARGTWVIPYIFYENSSYLLYIFVDMGHRHRDMEFLFWNK